MSALDRVRESGGAELAERLSHLDRVRADRAGTGEPTDVRAPAAPTRADAMDVDVILAGGGLWSIVAPLLAKRGFRTAVLDRARAGQAHREWNASGPELEALVRCGLTTSAELERMILARYGVGTCQFFGGPPYQVTGVLDHAVDAGALLDHGRRLAEARGVRFLDGHAVLAHASSRDGVRVLARGPQGAIELTGKVMIDARGVASPYANADLVCPTVGGVLRGLEMNPKVGEILVTVDGVENGRQHIWEAFPGRAGETTVYLFHYARAGERTNLLDLYGRFFEKLGGYKRGVPELIRPTFGFIPGWSRLSPPPRVKDDRIVLVGDAAARHSPLTYCGFGATLRSLEGCVEAIADILEGEGRAPACVVDDAPVHVLTGALAHMLASRAFHGQDLNQLLDAAFSTLHGMGNPAFAALLRDETTKSEFVTFLRRMARRYPAVWGQVMRGLGPRYLGLWGVGLLRSMVRSAAA